ncbi:MAG: hypothetical protein ACTSW1_00290 [Candidatus Hodarchaeales archaeon]
MASSVEIGEKTKEDLLNIKRQLERVTGKRYTIDDTIRWLIDKERGVPFKRRKELSKKYFATLKDLDLGLDDISKIRQERSSRIADF